MFRLSKRSRDKLAGVNPKLAAVVERAIELTEVDFVVVQGNRTQAEQDALYAQGRTKPGPKVTWTRNSNHIGGNAVDLAPWVNGAIEWDNSGRLGLYPHIAAAMQDAATELGVPITWGGSWKSTPDRPHFELKRG
jgi:peptidoglycan L-alanyl-D-glutamate endopeptidase CwlK